MATLAVHESISSAAVFPNNQSVVVTANVSDNEVLPQSYKIQLPICPFCITAPCDILNHLMTLGFCMIIPIVELVFGSATMKSAINTCKHLNVKSIIVAVPCGPDDIVEEIRPFVNKIICLTTPHSYRAVGQCYYSFPQTTDEEVIQIMKKYQDLTIFY
ncbi:unnamed protein product [Rotaria sp. Silwood2]|nr:unnamed protein product [Rotaria sp. Silwood2]